MSTIIGENGSGVYMGTILKGKPHGVGRFASDCNQSILEGQFREGHLYGYIREVFQDGSYRTGMCCNDSWEAYKRYDKNGDMLYEQNCGDS